MKTKRLIGFILKLLVSGVLLYIFLSRTDIDAVIRTLKQTKGGFFIAGFFTYMLGMFISTKRWSLFLPGALKYSRLLSLYFMGAFFNTFLPGLVGGDAVKAYYLYRDTGRGGISLASVFMDRYMGLTAMAMIGLTAFVIGYPYIKGSEIIWLVPAFCGAFLLGSLILWGVNWGRIRFLNSFYIPLMEYKTKKEILYRGLMLGLVVQGVAIISVYILSLSLELKVPLVSFFVFIPLITVASAVPVSIAGLGIREAGFVILFSRAGLKPEEALGLSLLLFAVMCLVNLIGGVEYLRAGKAYRSTEGGR